MQLIADNINIYLIPPVLFLITGVSLGLFSLLKAKRQFDIKDLYSRNSEFSFSCSDIRNTSSSKFLNFDIRSSYDFTSSTFS
jgi:hypothetical protein